MAERQIQEKQLDEARRTLAACPKEPRHWEWGWLQHRLLSQAQWAITSKGATAFISSSLAFSPDGQRLATGSRHGISSLWDTESGREVLNLKSTVPNVPAVAYSPDGRRIATGSGDGVIAIWDAKTGTQLRTFKDEGEWITCVTFSPEGKRLATSGTSGSAGIWDVETGNKILGLKGHTYSVHHIVFSPDGHRIATASNDKTVKVWDAYSGNELRTIECRGPVFAVAFSPDGKRLALGGMARTAKIVDAETGRELVPLSGEFRGVNFLTFSADGKRLAVGTLNGTIEIHETGMGRRMITLPGHSGVVPSAVAFSPDGRKIASTAGKGTALIWEALPWREKELPGRWWMSYEKRIRLYTEQQMENKKGTRKQDHE